jgi:protein O-GlcNAc transferase
MKSFRQDQIAKALLQATQLGQSGQLSDAAALCRQILEEYPDVAPAWHLLGLTALQQGQAATALEHIEKAIAFDPTVADFHNHAGVVQFQLGNLDTGIACYRKALLLQPQSIDAR